MSSFRAIFLILSTTVANLCFAYYAYVPDTDASTVFVIDTGTNSVIGTVSTGTFAPFGGPFCIVTSLDGSSTYVGDLNGTLYVIDTNPNSLSFNTVTATVPFPNMGESPFSLAVTPDGKTVYVGTNMAVEVFNTRTQSFTDPVMGITVVDVVSSIATYQDGTYAFAVDPGSGLYSIDTNPTSPTYNHASPIFMSPGGISVVFTPDGEYAFLTVWFVENVIVALYANPLNPDWSQFAGNFTLASPPFTPFAEPVAIAVNQQGSLAFVLDPGNQLIYTANAITGNVTQQTSVGLATSPPYVSLGVVPDGSAVYITPGDTSANMPPLPPAVYVMNPMTYSISQVTNIGFPAFSSPHGISFVGEMPGRAFKRPNNRR